MRTPGSSYLGHVRQFEGEKIKIQRLVTWAAVASSVLLFSASQADDIVYSGFMSDYTQLRKVADGTADYRYVAPGAEDKLIDYFAVMIDQPEIFIAPDSPYRGVKPKQLNALADALRAGIASALSQNLYIVDQSGKNVMYMSVAITNLKLTRKKKSLLGYTPVGLVTGAARGAATSDIAKKADLQSMVFEVEVFDSETGERLVALIDSKFGDKAGAKTWEELQEFMVQYGKLFQCRFDNARLTEEQRVDCFANQ